MNKPLSYMPALPGAAGIMTGILIHHSGVGIFAAVTGFVWFTLLYFTKRHYLAFFGLFISIGVILCCVRTPASMPRGYGDSERIYTARILSTSVNDNSVQYFVNLLGCDSLRLPQPVKCCVTVLSVEHEYQPGSLICMKATLKPVEAETDVPDEINPSQYLINEGVSVTAFLKPDMIAVVAPPKGLQRFVNHLRDSMFNAIVTAPVSGETASFLVAVILGDKQFLDVGTRDSFRSTGIAHLLALSGLHIGIIAAMISVLLLPLGFNRKWLWPKSLITIALIWLYAATAGMTPSIQRASVMLTVLMLVQLIGRGYMVYNSLLLSVIVILVIRPSALFSPGFQMSAVAVLSILLFSGIVPAGWKKRRWLWNAANMILIPVAAMIGTGVIGAYYFHSFPGMFLLANVVTGLLFPVILTAGVIIMIANMCCVPVAMLAWLGWSIDHLLRLMMVCVNYFSDLGAQVSNIYFSAWVLVPYSLAVLSFVLAVRHRKWLGLCATVAFVCLVWLTARVTAVRYPDAELYIPRHPHSTIIIARGAHEARLYASNPRLAEADIADANNRYREFLARRGCDSLALTTPSWSIPGITRTGNYIAFGNKVIRMIDSDSLTPSPKGVKVDYALVTEMFTGDINDVIDLVKPDTLVLASAINGSRRLRFLRTVAADSVPYVYTPVRMKKTR